MKKTYLFLLLCIVMSGFSLRSASAAPLSNAGLIPGDIWFSVATPKEGETISVYTLFFNGSSATLSGSIEFYDKGAILDVATFTVGPQESEQISVLWQVNAGDHVVSARAIGVVSTPVGGGDGTNVYLEQNITAPKTFFVSRSNFSPRPSSETVEPILNQVDSIESKFTAWIPQWLKNSVTNLIMQLEDFRTGVVQDYSIKNLDALNKKDVLSTRVSSVDTEGQGISPSTKFIEIPSVYGKLFWVALVLFVFSSQFVFYGLSILLVVFFVDRIINGIKKISGRFHAQPVPKTYKSLKS